MNLLIVCVIPIVMVICRPLDYGDYGNLAADVAAEENAIDNNAVAVANVFQAEVSG